MTLTFDLLTPKSIGHILDSWGASVWSFMIIGGLQSQLSSGNHFQTSVTDRQTDWRTDRVQTYSPLRFHRWGTNKHTVSIAEAIHVPYRPQQISKRHNSRKNTWKDRKVKNFLYYVNTNSYPKFDVNILQEDRKKCGKLNLSKRKYLVCNQVKRNKSQTWSVLCQDKFIYQNASSQYYKTGEESPEN